VDPAGQANFTPDVFPGEKPAGMGAERSGEHRANVTGAPRGIKQLGG
jgi:hypothetical protein